MIEAIAFYLELGFSMAGATVAFIKLMNGRFVLKRALAVLPVVALTVFLVIFGFEIYLFFSTVIAYMYSLLAFTEIDWKRRVYITLLLRAFSFALTSAVVLVVWCFIPKDVVGYVLNVSINALLMISLLLIPKRLISEKLNNLLLYTGKVTKIFIILFLFFLSLTAMTISYYPQSGSFSIWYLLVALFSLVLILSAIILPLMISNNISKNYYRRINEIEDEQLQVQSDYYKKLIEANSELKRFKHDHKNQLIVLQSYLDKNDVESAKQYITSSSEYITSLEGYNTGSYILDALLDDKSRRAQQVNTVIDFSGSIRQYSLEDIDLCIIFGNALDNAIEACEKLPPEAEKIISVKLNQQNSLLNITISNPVTEPPEIRNNMIVTAKSDSENHGMGLYSIGRTVKKYSGSYIIFCEDKIFTIKICLSV